MPAVSPDGRWLAYASNASGRHEVYVRPFERPGAPVLVSEGGGTEPAWSRDGRRVFYRGARHVVAATVAAGARLSVVDRRALFVDGFDGEMPHRNYDVSADGRGLVMVAPQRPAETETVVVLDWGAELRARLAAAR